MLTESFVAATETVKPPAAHLTSNLKDVGIFLHEFQPQSILRQGYKKSSVAKSCLAVSDNHIFAAQVGKAVVNVYSRVKGNQEATIPFPQKLSSLAFAEQSAILVLGTQDGKLILWEVATGRVTSSSASHIEAVTSLVIARDGDHVISASADSMVHVWSIKNIVTMVTADNSFQNPTIRNDPISSFSQHRSPISALAVAHSQHASTTFVVSASEDKTCYIWNLSNQQILRSILLVQIPSCAVMDPADRAVYIGSKDGGVQRINFLNEDSKTSMLDTPSRIAATAVQLGREDCFLNSAESKLDSAQCITISYDGTQLLTGHYSGKVAHWDVGKRRHTGEVSSLSGQPVTNMHMLRPDGFVQAKSRYVIHNVVKPRLELSADTSGNGSSSVVPADYVFHAQVLESHSADAADEVEVAITTDGTPQSMLDAAIQALLRNKVSGGRTKQNERAGGDATLSELYQADAMEEELKSLRAQVASHQKNEQERIDRHIAQLKKREAVGLQKRQAFFTARKEGKDGDDAMKPFMQQEREIDAESDEEAIAEGKAHSNGQPVDIKMKG